MPTAHLRKALKRLRMALVRMRLGLHGVDPSCYMAGRSVVAHDLVAGPYSYIGPGCRICPGVQLGAYVMLAPDVAIVGGDHRTDVPGTPMIFAGRPALRPTVVEADAWIGFRATLMAGVRVGRGAIVAAGAVVTHDIPPYEIHGGVPSRRIGDRFPDAEMRAKHDAMLAQPPTEGAYVRAKTPPTGPAPGQTG